jgi:hypothetical protein
MADAARTHAPSISEPKTNDPDVILPGVSQPPLMTRKFIFTLDNAAVQRWFVDQDTGRYSFRQLAVDGIESVKFNSVVRRFVAPHLMTTKLKILKHFCNQRQSGLKVHDECDFGELSVRLRLALSAANTGVVPFYYQPTSEAQI